MNNAYASNPYFRVTDDVADFFGTAEQSEVERSRMRRLLHKPLPEDEQAWVRRITATARLHFPEDDTKVADTVASMQRLLAKTKKRLEDVHAQWKEYFNAPVAFPSVSLLSRSDLFADEHVQHLIRYARVQAANIAERLLSLPEQWGVVVTETYDGKEYQIVQGSDIADTQQEWDSMLRRMHAAIELARLYAETATTVLEIRNNPMQSTSLGTVQGRRFVFSALATTKDVASVLWFAANEVLAASGAESKFGTSVRLPEKVTWKSVKGQVKHFRGTDPQRHAMPTPDVITSAEIVKSLLPVTP